MKISLNWAQNWTKVPSYTSEELQKFSHTYSTYTAEVEGIDSYIFDDRIVVGKVIAWKPHPDSDKLGLVQIDAGVNGQHEIVCGAPNAKTSQYVAVALENAVLPGGLVISRRAIRGVDSCGMICSLDELGLQTDRAEGIFPLETVWSADTLESHLGRSFGSLSITFPMTIGESQYFLNDVVFDLDNKFITNRPDLFSVVGNAREIACINKQDFTYTPSNTSKQENTNELNVIVKSDKVINYLLSEYSFTSLPESPFIIQTLLRRSNQGSHGLLPDLTNIVMTELGQPMHVFDADAIKGSITLRMAQKGEKFIGLDTKEYTLGEEDLVIVDDEKILAIAGVMGGLSSGATSRTRRIFVESATFDPVSVRKTSQRLGIRTDSSVRFEKGVDRTLPSSAMARYDQLLKYFIPDANDGKKTVITSQKQPTELIVSLEKISQKIGIEVTEKQVTEILSRLGFIINKTSDNGVNGINGSNFVLTVPSWRDTGDVDIYEDIVEEVARHIGYDTIPSLPLPGPLMTARVESYDAIVNQITAFFANRGYYDAYTYPFTLGERFGRFSDNAPAVIHNTSENRTHLRAHMAENLLELVSNNYRTHAQGAFFEFGQIFDGAESLQGVGVVWGKQNSEIQDNLTSYVMTFFGESGSISQGSVDTRLFSPNAYGEIIHSSGEVLVRFGLVRPTILPLFDVEGIDVYAFEIVKIPKLHRPIKFSPLVEFPGTRRELNFIMPETTPVALVTKLVQGADEWIYDVGVNEIYRDETHIGKDKKSVVVSFLIRNNTATITDEEAGKIQEKVVNKLAENGYQLRGV